MRLMVLVGFVRLVRSESKRTRRGTSTAQGNILTTGVASTNA